MDPRMYQVDSEGRQAAKPVRHTDVFVIVVNLQYLFTQEDLIIVEGELIIHRRAYLRIQRLAKS